VKRKATIIKTSIDGKRQIAIDEKNQSILKTYFSQDKRHIKKFTDICGIILDGLRNNELYKKENINKKCKGVMAMRFFRGQENDRIYCKEIHLDNKVLTVICAELLEKKKNQKNKQREKNLIKKVAGYEYEIR